MKFVHLKWEENPCGPRPDYYIVHYVNHPVRGDDERYYVYVGKTERHELFISEIYDNLDRHYIIRAVNQYGVGPPADYVASYGLDGFNVSGNFVTYSQDGEKYSAVLLREPEEGPTNLGLTTS